MEVNMPKYVDSQLQVLWWEADEFIISVTIIGVGIMFHTFLTPLAVVIFLMPYLSRMKRSALDGAAMHTFYNTGLVPLNKEFTDALEKEFYQ